MIVTRSALRYLTNDVYHVGYVVTGPYIPVRNARRRPKIRPFRQDRPDLWDQVPPKLLTALAVTIVGRRHAHLGDSWEADLYGDPDSHTIPSPKRKLLLAIGFIIAAVRCRLEDASALAWRPLDWILTSRRGSILVEIAPVAAAVIMVLAHEGFYGLVTHTESLVALAGLPYLAVKTGRAYRQIQMPQPQRPPGRTKVHPERALNLGRLCAGQGDVKGAEAAYQLAIESRHPDHYPNAALALGVMLDEQGRVDQAKAAYKVAIESSHPDHAPAAAIALAGLLERYYDVDGALDAYQMAIDSQHPQYAPAAVAARCALEKKYPEAREDSSNP